LEFSFIMILNDS